MTPSKFLKSLLDDQKLTDKQLKELESHREEVETILREEFGSTPLVRYAGSKAKGTMIQDSYDLDIVCYFPNDDERTISEIFSEVDTVLKAEFKIEKKTSALRISKESEEGEAEDYHIDVVPGKFTDEDKEDAYLHINSSEGERLKTNIYKHVAAVKDSKVKDSIKLMKLWNVRNNQGIKTFVLELIAVKALEENDSESLEERLMMVFEYLRDKLPSVRLEDPANSNNVISDTMSEEEKKKISAAAGEVLKKIIDAHEDEDDEITVQAWCEVFLSSATSKQQSFYPSRRGVVVSDEPIPNKQPITPNRSWSNR